MEEKVVSATQTPAVTPPSAEKLEVPKTPVEAKDNKPTVPETNDDPEFGKADPLLDGYYKSNPFFYEVADYFNIPTQDHADAAPKLSVIVDWLVQKYDVHTPEEILLKLRQSEDMVQKPGWDEKRYTNLFKYARLEAQQKSIGKAM
jgi:hypothetical protein